MNTPILAIDRMALDRWIAFMRGGNTFHAQPQAEDYQPSGAAIRSVRDAQRAGWPVSMVGDTAVIRLDGPLVKRSSWVSRAFGLGATEPFRRAVDLAAADPKVSRILLALDSPGGTTDGLAEAGDSVWAARQRKPVIAQIDGVAASAAYYLAANASEIRAGRTDLAGSVGSYIVMYDYSAAFEADGVAPVVLTSGEFKATGVPGAPITDAQREYLQGIVDQFFDDFRATLRRGRGLSSEQIDRVADGKVYLAPEAMTLGLVDRIAPLDETLSQFEQQTSRRSETARAKAGLLAHTLSAQSSR